MTHEERARELADQLPLPCDSCRGCVKRITDALQQVERDTEARMSAEHRRLQKIETAAREARNLMLAADHKGERAGADYLRVTDAFAVLDEALAATGETETRRG